MSNTSTKVNTTWRQQNVDVSPNGVTDVYFFDTKPNAFYLQNNSDTEIYVGMTATPTTERYDVMIDRYSSDTFGKPTACNRLYILNPSNKQISITIYSASNMFDMMLLKNFRVAIEKGVLNTIKFDGIIQGIKSGVSIPVTFDKDITVSMPDDLSVNANIPVEIINSIKGCQSNGADIITAFTKLLSNTDIAGTVTLKSIRDILTSISKNTGGTTVVSGDVNAVMSYENIKSGTVTTTGDIVFNYKEIDTIVNDSENDLAIVFDDSQTFILKQDESLSDIQYTGSKITFRGINVNARYILLG